MKRFIPGYFPYDLQLPTTFDVITMMAIAEHIPKIHHSDQGVQYLATLMLPRSRHTALRFLPHGGDGLGRTDMLKDSSARSKRKPFSVTEFSFMELT